MTLKLWAPAAEIVTKEAKSSSSTTSICPGHSTVLVYNYHFGLQWEVPQFLSDCERINRGQTCITNSICSALGMLASDLNSCPPASPVQVFSRCEHWSLITWHLQMFLCFARLTILNSEYDRSCHHFAACSGDWHRGKPLQSMIFSARISQES